MEYWQCVYWDLHLYINNMVVQVLPYKKWCKHTPMHIMAQLLYRRAFYTTPTHKPHSTIQYNEHWKYFNKVHLNQLAATPNSHLSNVPIHYTTRTLCSSDTCHAAVTYCWCEEMVHHSRSSAINVHQPTLWPCRWASPEHLGDLSYMALGLWHTACTPWFM